MPRRLSSPVFAGRASELDELMVAMARARDGAPGAVLVGGEAGVGKSRLVSELAVRAIEDGAQVLCGRCAATADGAIPLLALVEALGGLADGGGGLRDDDGLARWPESVGARAGARRGAASSMRLGAVVLERLVQAARTRALTDVARHARRSNRRSGCRRAVGRRRGGGGRP